LEAVLILQSKMPDDFGRELGGGGRRRSSGTTAGINMNRTVCLFDTTEGFSEGGLVQTW
jgi:hypothetical protein